MSDEEKHGEPQPWIECLKELNAPYDTVRGSVTPEEFAKYLKDRHKLPKADQVKQLKSEALAKTNEGKDQGK